MRWTVLIAGLLGAAGVAIGAHAAHGLEKMLFEQGLAAEQVAKRLSQCDVAVRYHLIHTVSLLSIGLLAEGMAPKRRAAATLLFILGITLFSGGLYSMVYVGEMGHWAIVPAGGMCFILGWLCTSTLAWKRGTET